MKYPPPPPRPHFLIQMPVETLGRAMVADAESKLGAGPEEDAVVFGNKDMKRLGSRREKL